MFFPTLSTNMLKFGVFPIKGKKVFISLLNEVNILLKVHLYFFFCELFVHNFEILSMCHVFGYLHRVLPCKHYIVKITNI